MAIISGNFFYKLFVEIDTCFRTFYIKLDCNTTVYLDLHSMCGRLTYVHMCSSQSTDMGHSLWHNQHVPCWEKEFDLFQISEAVIMKKYNYLCMSYFFFVFWSNIMSSFTFTNSGPAVLENAKVNPL